MSTPPLSLSTGSLHTRGPGRCFTFAAEHGLDGIEILCDPRPETHSAEHLRRLMDACRLPVTSVHAPFPSWRLDDWRPGAVAGIEQAVALAEELGAQHVVMHVPRRFFFWKTRLGRITVRVPCWSRHGATIRRWIRDGGLRDLQAGTPVTICVENLPRLTRWLSPRWTSSWNTLDEWPNAHEHLALDTTHWATHGVAPLDAWRAGGDRIRHIHLSNFRDGHQHELPHRGELDLAAFLRRVAEDAFDGHIVLEFKPDALEAEDDARLHQNLADAIAFCRDALAAKQSAASTPA